MGLFDNLTCHLRLPGVEGEPPYSGFQTKDLDCYMHDYTITPDGMLVQYEYDYQDDPSGAMHPMLKNVPMQVAIESSKRVVPEKGVGWFCFYGHHGEFMGKHRDGRVLWIDNLQGGRIDYAEDLGEKGQGAA